jgi:hypothetical protein
MLLLLFIVKYWCCAEELPLSYIELLIALLLLLPLLLGYRHRRHLRQPSPSQHCHRRGLLPLIAVTCRFPLPRMPPFSLLLRHHTLLPPSLSLTPPTSTALPFAFAAFVVASSIGTAVHARTEKLNGYTGQVPFVDLL